MSVASVLERQPNVRDISEVLFVRPEPWENLDLFSDLKFSFFFFDSLIAFPELVDFYPQTMLDDRKNRPSKGPGIDAFVSRLYDQAVIRIVSKDLAGNLNKKKLFSESEKFVENFKENKITRPRDIRNLRSLFYISINFPEIDLSQITENTFTRDYLNDLLFQEYDGARASSYCVDALIIGKFMRPDLVKELDVVGSALYRSMLDYTQSPQIIKETIVNIAGQLKILSAERIRKTSTGYDLEMPNSRFPKIFAMPEQRRFEA